MANTLKVLGGSYTADDIQATDSSGVAHTYVEPSGTKQITGAGTVDVAAYENASVPSGSAATPATAITANPSISVSGSGLITASVSKSQSVTPAVSPGYVSSGTAGTVEVSGSNTQQLSTQAAQTIHPSTSDQTIASGKYLTGVQTVKGVLLTNLLASVIKKDEVVKVGDSTDDDCVVSVTGTYEASGGGEEDVWELINSTTTTAEVASLMWNTDTNGDGFSLRKLMIVGTFICPDAATNTGVGVAGAATASGAAGWNNGGLWTGGNWIPQGAGVAAGTASHMAIMLENRLHDLGIGGWTLTAMRSANATSLNGQVFTTEAGWAARWAHQMTNNSTSDLFTLSSGVPATLSKVWFGSYSTVFGVGSTFRLYGVRD